MCIRDRLEDDAEIMPDTERVITGISEEPVTTIGLINLNIKMNGNEIVHPFQVVYDKFPIRFPIRSNCFLSRDFVSKYKDNVDYKKGVVQVRQN